MTGQNGLRQETAAAATQVPSFSEALRIWWQVGLTSFGGPAGQIAMMHRLLVDQKKWIDERTYIVALNFCTLLPGPEAMQLATYAGWRMHGVKGGLAAGLLFVLPGGVLILALAALYASYGNVPFIAAIFDGIKAAVLAIVIEALLKIARRSLKDGIEWVVAALSFVAIFFFKVPFPIIVLVAGLFGYWRAIGRADDAPPSAASPAVPISATLGTIGLWLAIWLLPMFAVAAIFGGDHVLTKLAQLFSQLAVVSFGGAYAVLAYVTQDAVQTYGWLQPGEMLDGLGLAETTPGPLILVTEFVGYLAAYRQGDGPKFLMGCLGALVTLWATFAPCFLYIFAGAPYIEWLKSAPKLKSALNAITAAVVGVILNLSAWFALHVLFLRVRETTAGPLHLTLPDLSSLDLVVASLAILAAILILRLHFSVVATLAICGGITLALTLV